MSEPEKRCGTCAHGNRDYVTEVEFRGAYVPAANCVNPASWFHGKNLPLNEGCTKWEAGS